MTLLQELEEYVCATLSYVGISKFVDFSGAQQSATKSVTPYIETHVTAVQGVEHEELEKPHGSLAVPNTERLQDVLISAGTTAKTGAAGK